MTEFRYANTELDVLLKRISEAHIGGAEIPCLDSPSLDWVSDETAAQKRAIAGCNACPFQTACADYAMTFGEPSGIWGGTKPRERCKPTAVRKEWIEVKTP